jgi:hypothetical protein
VDKGKVKNVRQELLLSLTTLLRKLVLHVGTSHSSAQRTPTNYSSVRIMFKCLPRELKESDKAEPRSYCA